MVVIRCKHCKKEIKGKVKIVGLTTICPYCYKPSECIGLLNEEKNK